MITGDIKETAQSIAKDIGIIRPQDDINDRSFTGHEFITKKLEDQQTILKQVIREPSGLVFARTEPIHKQTLIDLLSKEVRNAIHQ